MDFDSNASAIESLDPPRRNLATRSDPDRAKPITVLIDSRLPLEVDLLAYCELGDTFTDVEPRSRSRVDAPIGMQRAEE